MNIVKHIATENVVYLATYKAAKNIRRGLIGYKNTVFALAPHERDHERVGLQLAALSNPLDVVVKMKLALLDEVECG